MADEQVDRMSVIGSTSSVIGGKVASSLSKSRTITPVTEISPTQRILQARSASLVASSKASGLNKVQESEGFLRLKALELKKRLVFYQNIGGALGQAGYQQVFNETRDIMAKLAALNTPAIKPKK